MAESHQVGRILSKLTSPLQKAQLSFTTLMHLWRHRYPVINQRSVIHSNSKIGDDDAIRRRGMTTESRCASSSGSCLRGISWMVGEFS